MTIVIIGIGQSLRGDDGAGLAAVACWQNAYPSSAQPAIVRVVQVEVTGVALLDELLGTEAAILVDAVRSRRKPGSLHLLRENDLIPFQNGTGSAHGLGVAEALALGRQIYADRMPSEVILIGIEAGDIGMGDELSPVVSASLSAAANLIESQLRRLQKHEIRE